MTYAEIKDAVLDGRRIEGAPHEELLWYQLREIQSAKKQLLPPDKIAEREHSVKLAFQLNATHEEIGKRALKLVTDLRICVQHASAAYMKDRTLENADRLMRLFYNLPSFGKETKND